MNDNQKNGKHKAPPPDDVIFWWAMRGHAQELGIMAEKRLQELGQLADEQRLFLNRQERRLTGVER